MKMSNRTYPNEQLLKDANWLHEHINDENLVILDARVSKDKKITNLLTKY